MVGFGAFAPDFCALAFGGAADAAVVACALASVVVLVVPFSASLVATSVAL